MPARNGRSEWMFVDWVEQCSRSEKLAEHLGMEFLRHYRARKNLGDLLSKYVWVIPRTFWDLLRRRPAGVICMNPPPLTALPVWLYATWTRRRWMIDAHTGAFIGDPWGRFAFLSRFFCRRATRTLVTNEYLSNLVVRAGGRPFLVQDVPTETEPPHTATLSAGFHVVFAGSWAPDEPLAAVIEAATAQPEVTFHITGRPKGPGAELLRNAPPNVCSTGFLERDDYLALVAAADVVLALTTRDHTMQRCAYEAIYLGTPVIVSDWPVLRDNFSEGGIPTANDGPSLAAAVGEARSRIDELARDAEKLRVAKLDRWKENERQLRAIMEGRG